MGFAVVLLSLALRRPAPADPIILGGPFSKPLLVRDRLAQLGPSSSAWTWLWGKADVIFGRRKIINIITEAVAAPDSEGADLLSRLSLGEPDFVESGRLQVWFLRADKMKSFRAQLRGLPGAEILGAARFMTADGTGASLFQGESVVLKALTNEVGLKVDIFPRARPLGTDLIASLNYSRVMTNENAFSREGSSVTERVIHTDLEVAARLQIPIGGGVLLLNPHADEAGGKRFGFIIELP